jgi:cyclopropane fatty-acyl-phospholipid synthase-like methyltransferase
MNLSESNKKILKAGDHDYRAYVGPPERYDLIAAMTFNLLTTLGLREYHKVLDIGCGSLRIGRLLIPYLNTGNYTGIEPNQWLVHDGIAREMGEDLLKIKMPKLIFDADGRALPQDDNYDFVFAQSIFSHCGVDLITQWLSDVYGHLKPEGLFLATYFAAETDSEISGWVYPTNVSYTTETIKSLAQNAGLHFEILDWIHPAQQWALFHKDGYDPSWLRQGGDLSWNRMAKHFNIKKAKGS